MATAATAAIAASDTEATAAACCLLLLLLLLLLLSLLLILRLLLPLLLLSADATAATVDADAANLESPCSGLLIFVRSAGISKPRGDDEGANRGGFRAGQGLAWRGGVGAS